MKLFLSILLSFSLQFNLKGEEKPPLFEISYQECLLDRVGEKLPDLANYPTFQFPNAGYDTLPPLFPSQKVLIFGYGSLINKQSASKNVKEQAIKSMHPVVAFGTKRIFNYQAKKTAHWGDDQESKEKAMLNLSFSLNLSSIVNGIAMEVDLEDLAALVKREKGYDLVPVLIAPWKEALSKDRNIDIKIAYTFVAPTELRDHVIYTSTEYYPVRGYLDAIQEGALEYGQEFVTFWNATTYLADGTTTIEEWDEKTFKGILCTKQAIE